MRNYIFIFYSIFFLFDISNAQTLSNEMKGYVFDETTGYPLENVNVYIANTTFGSSTNREGYFNIKGVPPGIKEIVVTIIGYEVKTHSVLIHKDSHVELKFRLKPVIYEVEATEVIADFPTEWLRDLKHFTKLFIGQSEFAENCELKNPEVVDFTWSASGIMRASAQKPLMIINHSLGYRIRCVLVTFIWNKKKNKCSWLAKSEFTDIQNANSMQRKMWTLNRKRAYYGSLIHFLKSMIERRLLKDNFVTYFVDEPGQRNKQQELLQSTIDYNYVLKPSPIESEYSVDFIRYMCVIYNSVHSSWIKLTGASVLVDLWGQPQEPNPFDLYGYWSEKGIADQLPMYFDPNESQFE